jgi:hypothetical protein
MLGMMPHRADVAREFPPYQSVTVAQAHEDAQRAWKRPSIPPVLKLDRLTVKRTAKSDEQEDAGGTQEFHAIYYALHRSD